MFFRCVEIFAELFHLLHKSIQKSNYVLELQKLRINPYN